jgi:D-sedoheptulose 7-phosphate isomerase
MIMTTDDLWEKNFADHLDIAQATRAGLFEPFKRLLTLSLEAVRGGGKLLFFGNGGSAADAQHLATELTVRYVDDRPPIPAIALTTDSSALTAIGNDMGFEALFARQIEALGRPGDVVIGLSTSGRSPNIIQGLKQARGQGLTAAAFSGHDGGDLVGLADPLLIVKSTVTARIQEMHITLGHILCDGLERGLGLV